MEALHNYMVSLGLGRLGKDNTDHTAVCELWLRLSRLSRCIGEPGMSLEKGCWLGHFWLRFRAVREDKFEQLSSAWRHTFAPEKRIVHYVRGAGHEWCQVTMLSFEISRPPNPSQLQLFMRYIILTLEKIWIFPCCETWNGDLAIMTSILLRLPYWIARLLLIYLLSMQFGVHLKQL